MFIRFIFLPTDQFLLQNTEFAYTDFLVTKVHPLSLCSKLYLSPSMQRQSVEETEINFGIKTENCLVNSSLKIALSGA